MKKKSLMKKKCFKRAIPDGIYHHNVGAVTLYEKGSPLFTQTPFQKRKMSNVSVD